MNKSGSKRKADSSEIAVPAKRSANVLVPEEVLRTMAASLNAATLALMDLPCGDVAARGCAVAVIADCKRQMNDLLGIQRRTVSKRFNAIIVKKLTMVCLRLLSCAKMSRSGAQRHFVLLMGVVGTKKLTRLSTGVNDEPAATTLLLNACRSSRVESLELYGMAALGVDFFDALALSAPTIFLKNFGFGNRILPDDVPHDSVLRALRSFAELKTTTISPASVELPHSHLQICLIRSCFKIGVSLVTDPLGDFMALGTSDTAAVEDALLEYCFGVCDEQYATRDRSLHLIRQSLNKDFLRRWIERAEVTDCRHELTLDIAVWQRTPLQDTAALHAYKRGPQSFGSASGRHWAAHNSGRQIIFKVNP
ncbi:hypothetical protein AAVH_27347 [Aphelenchoides avenae]|nr:hypothetical protein AAVH_27347 [Aphelenchus avenae]